MHPVMELRAFSVCNSGANEKDVKHTIVFTLLFRLYVANGVTRYGNKLFA